MTLQRDIPQTFTIPGINNCDSTLTIAHKEVFRGGIIAYVVSITRQMEAGDQPQRVPLKHFAGPVSAVCHEDFVKLGDINHALRFVQSSNASNRLAGAHV